MASQLFSTKSPDQLLHESENPERQMKRTLSAFDLTALGIGAIVGAGIFSLVGTASAGETFSSKIKTPLMNYIIAGLTGTDVQLGRPGAGPALVISLTLAAVACTFAAFCYAELASMIPVSGSAYTYSYATLGEIFAWIIGWDLILEYAVGNMAVAVSWSGYFIKLLYALFGLRLPLWLVSDHTTATAMIKDNSENLQYYSSTVLPTIGGMDISINLPALLIVLLLTVLLVYGIRESARANTIAVVIKMGVLIFFIAFGAFYVSPTNWTPFNPNGISGIMTGSAIIFFAFIGFDAVSTTAEEAKNPKRDLPIGIISSLVICTILYVLVAGVMTGLKHYSTFAGDASPIASAIAVINKPWLQALISAGALAGSTSVLLVFQLGQPRIFMAMGRDGLLPTYFSKIHPIYRTPHITTIWTGIIVGVVAMVMDIGSLADLTNIGTLFAFILVCLGVIVLRKTQPNSERSFRVPWVPIFPLIGAIFCLALMLSLPIETWLRFVVWLAIGLFIYYTYGIVHSSFNQDAEKVGFWLLAVAFLLPPIGAIIYFGLKDSPIKAKRVGQAATVGLATIVLILLSFRLLDSLGSH